MGNDIAAQSLALKQTAEKMIDAKYGGQAVEASVRELVDALVKWAKSAYGGDPVIVALRVAPNPTWSEVLMVANAVYAAV